MARNVFADIRLYGKRVAPALCVFISHKKEDGSIARAVANTLISAGIDVYFDEADTALQTATATGDDKKIAECIEAGLDACSHLLGIITNRTKGSWWVPYEIGGAMGRKKGCGHLVSKDVTELPSYIKVAPVIIDLDALGDWIAEVKGRREIFLKEAAIRSASASGLDQYVPKSRASYSIRYTS